MPEISNRIEKGVITLTELSQIINKDRQMIRAILDAINSPVLVFDKDGFVTWRNHNANQIKTLREMVSFTELEIQMSDINAHLVDQYGYKKGTYNRKFRLSCCYNFCYG